MNEYFDTVLSLCGQRWRLRSYDELQSLAISQKFNLPLTLSNLLVSRGITVEKAGDFLSPTLKRLLPNPAFFKDLNKTVERLIIALERNHKIVIFGDYDVDGATSSAVLYRYLKEVGGDIFIYIPDRMKEGYGPNIPAFLNFSKQGIKLIVTVDCGTTSFEPLQQAKTLGIDVIVIDHHVPEDSLPPAYAILNPNRLDESGAYNYLAAVGMCFILLVGLNQRLREKGFFQHKPEPDLMSLLDLVALGTICDVMPLKDLNRAFVVQGLKVMKARRNLGLKALMDVAAIHEAPSPYHLGFILGPRVNAGGRVGQADLGATLLTTENSTEAERIAYTLNNFNQMRQEIEQEVLMQAVSQAEKQANPILICQGRNWHQGVIGIVASRLKERFFRPTLIISVNDEGIGKGSGRSVSGLNLGALIHAAKQKGLLMEGGGHAMAVGFVLDIHNIQAFEEFLNEQIQSSPFDLTPELVIDGHLTLKGALNKFVENLNLLGPYGQGNPSPRFLFENLSVVSTGIVGKEHIKCVLFDEDNTRVTGISFRSLQTPLGETLLRSQGEKLHIVGSLKINSWQGEECVQLIVEDAMWARALLRKVS
jgi:single-stranded-DNA-specific exonuclease